MKNCKNCKCCPLSLLIEESHRNKCKNCPYGQRKTLLKKLPIYRKFQIYCIVCTLYKLSVLYCLLCLYSCIIYPVCSVRLHCMHHLVWSAWNCETWSKLGCKYAPRPVVEELLDWGMDLSCVCCPSTYLAWDGTKPLQCTGQTGSNSSVFCWSSCWTVVRSLPNIW